MRARLGSQKAIKAPLLKQNLLVQVSTFWM